MFGMGMGELVVVFFIILLLFGADKLPEVAGALGKSVRDFKKAANEIRESIDVNAAASPEKPSTGNNKILDIASRTNSDSPKVATKDQSQAV